MASIENQPVEQVDKICLRVLVDKERNKVLYAESDKDFVDVLFSFFTLPLGTIARLVAENSNIEAVRFGSFSSLHQSVSDIDQQYLWNQTCKEMLLKPRNSLEAYCQQLKLNIDDTEPVQYFVCPDWECLRKVNGCLMSMFRSQKCFCGKQMTLKLFPECLNLENGFVKQNVTFIISDDLNVFPNAFGASLHILQKLGVDTFDAIEEQTLDIDKKEVVDILKLSLISKAPLTDFVLRKNQTVDNLILRNNSEFLVGDISSDGDRQMCVKVTIRKSNEQILFVEAMEDFIDFIFSFLTFPLGGVLHMLQGFSSLTCIDNLYKSLSELNSDIFLISDGLKDKLTKPLIAAQYELSNQTLPIGAATLHMNYCHTYSTIFGSRFTILTKEEVYSHNKGRSLEMFVRLKLVDPKFNISKSSFVRGPPLYMVTDDLCVTPMSSISTMTYLKRTEVPLSDLEERVVKVGVKEGLSLLKASLFSTSALHYGLKQFLKTNKEEK